jgi:tetratricopeptide (TPR) repeat protein
MVAADSKAKFLQDAERYVLHGKVQQAIGEYLKIIKFDPDDVLILNTIGDLYLRQGKSFEANKYFSQVAEKYVQNNFFLKAIAVYKKILNADPNNLEVNTIMASLYAKQGLGIDTRTQYLRLAGLLEKEGKSRESREALEKLIELDPSNSAVQRKLAELYNAEGAKDKAHICWTGAARALAKAGDAAGATDSYRRALQLNPLDVDSLRGFLDCSQKLNDPVPALNQLKNSVELAPDKVDLREMLGQAYIANNDPENAAKAFEIVFGMDDSRYGNFIAVADQMIERKEFDQALACLDRITPTLISHRETERAVQVYQSILKACPSHLGAMEKLTSIHSATGDQARCVEAWDKIVDLYIERKSPAEAIPYVEKILEAVPDSNKHRNLHRDLFSRAFPDIPYVSPAEPIEPVCSSDSVLDKKASSGQGNAPEIVEVDLLINYGLKDKAESLLLSLEARDPFDKEARLRLLSLFKSEGKYAEAARQCLLLAALYRGSRNEKDAQSCLAEAKQLAPEMGEYAKDLESFARMNGIVTELPVPTAPDQRARAADMEVDLSPDLLDIFFAGDQNRVENQPSQQTSESAADSLSSDISSQVPAKPVQEQLQEVDFYIRLGFYDEARTKLNEIAKSSPNDPELKLRYERLGEIDPLDPPASGIEDADEALSADLVQAPPDAGGLFDEIELSSALDRFVESASEDVQAPKVIEFPSVPDAGNSFPVAPIFREAPILTAVPKQLTTADSQTNEMFADLMEEVGALSDQEVSRESFDDHFSLGIAYRDMDLNEEAIREFELASRIASSKQDSGHVIQCCGMLSNCFLKKGMPTSALRWCQTGLSVADISSHESIALRYDMGVAHSMSGSKERALDCFGQIFSLDPGYRDVAQRIDELRANR